MIIIIIIVVVIIINIIIMVALCKVKEVLLVMPSTGSYAQW